MIPRFRAWIKKQKAIVETSDIVSIDFEDEMVEIQNVYFVDGLPDSRDLETYRFDEIKLMQSTGLKDKNGKEIFEGDIIQTSAFACIVGFGKYTYIGDRNTLETEIGFYLSFLNIKPATYAPFDKYYWDNCEVIGNIYQNELDLIMYEAWKFNKEVE